MPLVRTVIAFEAERNRQSVRFFQPGMQLPTEFGDPLTLVRLVDQVAGLVGIGRQVVKLVGVPDPVILNQLELLAA